MEQNKYIEINKGKVLKILIETTYTNPDNQEIIIQQQDIWKICNGDYVYIFGKQVDNAIINFSKSKNLIVRDGIVVRLERKNKIARALSKYCKEIFTVYHE